MYSVRITGRYGIRIFYFSTWELAVEKFYNLKSILKIESSPFRYADRSFFSMADILRNENLYFTEAVDSLHLQINNEILDIERTDEELQTIIEGLA